MLRILTVCGAGVGSSMMLKVFTQQILNNENIEAVVNASDIGSINPQDADIIITTTDFSNLFRNTTGRVLQIDNLTDKENLRVQLLQCISEIEK